MKLKLQFVMKLPNHTLVPLGKKDPKVTLSTENQFWTQQRPSNKKKFFVDLINAIARDAIVALFLAQNGKAGFPLGEITVVYRCIPYRIYL